MSSWVQGWTRSHRESGKAPCLLSLSALPETPWTPGRRQSLSPEHVWKHSCPGTHAKDRRCWQCSGAQMGILHLRDKGAVPGWVQGTGGCRVHVMGSEKIYKQELFCVYRCRWIAASPAKESEPLGQESTNPVLEFATQGCFLLRINVELTSILLANLNIKITPSISGPERNKSFSGTKIIVIHR